MKLSAEQFADLAASFQPEPRRAANHERRRSTRIELEADLVIRLLDENGRPGPAVTVLIHDFSSRGIAIRYETPLSPGAQFVVELARQSGGRVSMLCTVMHSRPLDARAQKIGAEFTCMLAEHPGAVIPQDVVDAELKRIRESVLE